MILGAVAPQRLAARPAPDVTFSNMGAMGKHSHSNSNMFGMEQDDAALLMDADGVSVLRIVDLKQWSRTMQRC